MGQIYTISCTCGYKTKVFLGGGLASCNLNMIKRIFSQQKLEEFNTYLAENKVKTFATENELCLCDTCKEIMNVAVFKYELVDNTYIVITNDCNICLNKVHVFDDKSIICPKCGKEITKKQIGDWD